MDLIITKISNESALLSLSPRVKNDGGTSGVVTLNLELKDAEDDRIVDRQGANLGVIRADEVGIAKLSYTVRDNSSYDIYVEVFEDGEGVIMGRLTKTLNLTTTEKDKLLKLNILEEGRPPAPVTTAEEPYGVGVDYETPPEEPGFEAVFGIAGILAVAYILRKRR
ncbi:MAG: PGF-CTERM sorting domain-containing protein [Halobacteriota archaeon]|nr:PGF-CTERM sorting domain-containing protein [Halobacteriota archaeon]